MVWCRIFHIRQAIGQIHSSRPSTAFGKEPGRDEVRAGGIEFGIQCHGCRNSFHSFIYVTECFEFVVRPCRIDDLHERNGEIHVFEKSGIVKAWKCGIHVFEKSRFSVSFALNSSSVCFVSQHLPIGPQQLRGCQIMHVVCWTGPMRARRHAKRTNTHLNLLIAQEV